MVPDNVLFAVQAGAVFEDLTKQCVLHTAFRLPNWTFSAYSPGTKANVISFTKGIPTESV
ncbi:MAG: hypothetical protein ACXQTG_05955 [Methanoculleaceae archaeon]